jgi:hypothetical protein
MAVPPGSFVTTARPPSRSAVKPSWVLFPLPSIPSKVMNATIGL